MPRPLRSSIPPRRPQKRQVSRSFRVPKDVDRALEEEAIKRSWTKTFLIRDIIVSWLVYHKALKVHVDAPPARGESSDPG